MAQKPPSRRLTKLVGRVLRRPTDEPVDRESVERQLLKAAKAQNAMLAEVATRLDRIERELGDLRSLSDKLFARVRHVEPAVQAVLRGMFLDPETLPCPERLTAHRFRLNSQNQEDGVTLGLFKRIGVANHRFVELGSGLSGGNSAVLALELGWTGLMVDGDARHITQVGRRFPGVTARSAWITAENVDEIVARHGFGGEIDLLSIDLDGNDYWIWKAITVSSPRVVIVEYNSIFGPDRAVTIPYDAQFDRSKHRFIYYGASLAALARLASQKGYRLVATTAGINAYFLRNDVAPEIPACEPGRAYRLLEKYDVLIQDKNLDVFQWIAEEGLPLVEV